MSEYQITILMTAATSYADIVATLFNLFLVVVFGSLGFAASISLKSIGKTYRFYNFSCSSSSLIIAAALFAFFIICFISFQSSTENLRIVLTELHLQIDSWPLKDRNTLSAFKPSELFVGKLGLPDIGFIIGSALTLIGFLLISNAERGSEKRT